MFSSGQQYKHFEHTPSTDKEISKFNRQSKDIRESISHLDKL